MFIQILNGIIIDRLWVPTRTSIPWYDTMHWFLGRSLFIISFVNIPLGLSLYSSLNYSDKITSNSAFFYGLYFAWVIILIFCYVIFSRKYGNVQHKVNSTEVE